MYHELHVLLSYVEDADKPVHLTDVPAHITSMFHPHTFDALSLPLAFKALKTKSWISHFNSGYCITPKGKKAVSDYKSYIDAEHAWTPYNYTLSNESMC